MTSPKEENIKVVIRCRPLSQKELQSGFKPIVRMLANEQTVQLLKDGNPDDVRSFPFNSVYSPDATQQFVYDDSARSIVNSVLEGYNGTIFAYGQTGTGKTFTMEGYPEKEELKGIILHSFDHIFAYISHVKDRTFLVRASYLQIYMEDVYDLLGDPGQKLTIRSAGDEITVVGLSQHCVKNPEEITKLLLKGKQNRAVGETLMNKESSRSHSVFTVAVEQMSEEKGSRMGKLHLVDLAGSERLAKTGATGERAAQGNKINLSLLSLGNVISALVTGSKHVPYRDSKLTRILQDSLGGNSKTVMIANIGPASYNYEETLSSLLYASRAKQIKNIPKVNMDPKDAMLAQLKEKIELLKKRLASQGGMSSGLTDEENATLKEIEARHNAQMSELEKARDMTEDEKAKTREMIQREYERQVRIKEESDSLRKQLGQMEQSVLVGGKNLVDVAKQQEQILRDKHCQMVEQKEQQRLLAEQKKKNEEAILLMEQEYGNLQDEISAKQKKN